MELNYGLNKAMRPVYVNPLAEKQYNTSTQIHWMNLRSGRVPQERPVLIRRHRNRNIATMPVTLNVYDADINLGDSDSKKLYLKAIAVD